MSLAIGHDHVVQDGIGDDLLEELGQRCCGQHCYYWVEQHC
jgi:hypothetical protein